MAAMTVSRCLLPGNSPLQKSFYVVTLYLSRGVLGFFSILKVGNLSVNFILNSTFSQGNFTRCYHLA